MRGDSAWNGAQATGESLGGWFWPVLGLSLSLSFPYYFSLETFFSHDDFAILWFHKDWPVWEPWVFLRPQVLTFYRPLQSYVMAVLYYFFDMTPFPYCLLLVAIHLATVVLFGRMVERVFENRALTFLGVIFFAADWQYWEVVVWKANYGTALSWFFALAAANAFLDFLRRGRWWRYGLALVLMVGALLSKETACNIALLLSLLYWMVRPGATKGQAQGGISRGERAGLGASVLDFARLLVPFYLLAVAYLAFHRLAVRDVYHWIEKGYEWNGAGAAVEAVVKSLAFWLTPFFEWSLLLLGREAQRPAAVVWGLPLVLVAAAIALRNRRLIFGLLWAVMAFFPANLITDYDTPRYYYGAIMGVAVIFAEIFVGTDRAISRRWSFGIVAAVRVVGALLILAFVYGNMILTTTIVGIDRRKCREIEDLYLFLVRQRERGLVPPKTLFRVRCLNQRDHFHEGMGLREMFRLALRDDTAVAILPDQRLTSGSLEILLTEYPPPVEVDRLPTGEFRFLVPSRAGPTTGTPGGEDHWSVGGPGEGHRSEP